MPDIIQSDWIMGLIGGMLIGLSIAGFLIFNGRIAGISGVVDSLLATPKGAGSIINVLFVVGIIGGAAVTGSYIRQPDISVDVALPAIAVAGLLVGIGTRMANGCTSGHGVCGLSRGSGRSLVATLTFMAAAIVTATLSTLW